VHVIGDLSQSDSDCCGLLRSHADSEASTYHESDKKEHDDVQPVVSCDIVLSS
jgi:hypothetical protein